MTKKQFIVLTDTCDGFPHAGTSVQKAVAAFRRETKPAVCKVLNAFKVKASTRREAELLVEEGKGRRIKKPVMPESKPYKGRVKKFWWQT